jgi:divalent metal cation (Fe/Co/Zn/Cd) transporter
MIIYTSLGLGRRTLDILLDKAPKGAHEQILESVSGLNDINSMHNIRVRRVGTKIFVDMHIEVPRTYTHDRAHRVATAVEERVKRSLPNSDVLVHVDAVEISNEKIRDRIRLIAAETEGIRNVHSIYLSTLSSSLSDDKKSGGLDLSDKRNKLPLCLYLDVQMDDNLDLKAAHGIIDAFEKTLKNEVSDVLNITTHIETETSKDVAIGREKKTNHLYLEKIRNAALSIDRVVDCGDIRVIDISNELHVILTIKIDSASEKAPTIEDAHKVATNVQDLLTKQTGASRVVVHTEPA